MAGRSRRTEREGILLVDKPAGPTSHDIVARVRRALGLRRVGHAGTLDPFATGLLVLCVGRATRLARFIAAETKVYRGTIRLGLATDTDDTTGRPLRETPPPYPSAEEIRRAAAGFLGEQLQTPPAYSAKKLGGVPAHRRARRGESPRIPPARVTIHSLEITEADGSRVEFLARVSAGTYLRALARDLGERLGTGGCLGALRRIASGPMGVAEAVPPDLPADGLAARILPLDRIPLGLPTLVVTREAAGRLLNGQAVSSGPVEAGRPCEGARVRLAGPDGAFLGIGRLEAREGEAGLLRPEVLFPADGGG